MRSWHSTDLDGKRLGAGVVLAQRIEDAHRAAHMYVAFLQDESISGSDQEKIQDALDAFTVIAEKLDGLAERADEIRKMASGSKEYSSTIEEFQNIFTSMTYKGQNFSNGPSFTSAVISDLRALAKSGDLSPAATKMVERVVIAHNQNGMSLGRQQFRHDHNDYFTTIPGKNSILGNLLDYLEDQHPEIMKELIPSGKRFGDLQHENQAYFFKRLHDEYGDQLKSWLLESNPATWDPSKPKDQENEKLWANEILQHIILVSETFNHKRSGEMIIANSDPMSAIFQQSIFEAVGLKGLKHIHLNESKETVEMVKQTLELYLGYFGVKNMDASKEMTDEIASFIVKTSLSDTQKLFGPFMRTLQRAAEKDEIKLSLEFKAAVKDQKGGGMSYGRGGCAISMLPRHTFNLIEEVRCEFIQENNRDFNEEEKAILKKINSFVANTVQGRGPGIMIGTSQQVYDLLLNVHAETTAASLAIDGQIAPEIVAPKPAQYSPAMKALMKSYEENSRVKYDKMRSKQSMKRENGTERLNLYMQRVAALTVTKMNNISQRFSNRPGEIPNLIDSRAINMNKVFVSAETKSDGSYGLGAFLRNLYSGYKSGDITDQDLQTLWHDDEWRDRYMFSNAMTALSSADYEYGFDVLDPKIKENGRWTIGKLLEAADNKYEKLRRDPGKEDLAFHADFTVDAIEATAFMEALANTALGKGGVTFKSPYKKIIHGVYEDKDTLEKLKFGKHTREKFEVTIEEGEHMHADMRLISAIQHTIENKIQNGELDEEKDAALIRHVSLAHRLYGPYNMTKHMDICDFGSRKAFVYDLIRQFNSLDEELIEKLGIATPGKLTKG